MKALLLVSVLAASLFAAGDEIGDSLKVHYQTLSVFRLIMGETKALTAWLVMDNDGHIYHVVAGPDTKGRIYEHHKQYVFSIKR